MPDVEPTAGTIEYEDTGGDSPVVALLHGLAERRTATERDPPPDASCHRTGTATGTRHRDSPPKG
ncbi:hypothetical protein FM21_20240 [Streptomyces mutabilis]|uniref:Uncharacterized protein n=1 Tax=Streptomyces mutabilis TaxID=67332 RepID=A0A086MW97_9ACTN|nr:hypothetical protein FM21_20240 [Streptomyces mutabilis]